MVERKWTSLSSSYVAVSTFYILSPSSPQYLNYVEILGFESIQIDSFIVWFDYFSEELDLLLSLRAIMALFAFSSYQVWWQPTVTACNWSLSLKSGFTREPWLSLMWTDTTSFIQTKLQLFGSDWCPWRVFTALILFCVKLESPQVWTKWVRSDCTLWEKRWSQWRNEREGKTVQNW